jgi:hypothetical protein
MCMLSRSYSALAVGLRVARLTACLVLAACSAQPTAAPAEQPSDDGMRADFSGSWQRNYIRDDTVNGALMDAYDHLLRLTVDRQRYPGPAAGSGPSQRDQESLIALARLAELITRNDVVTIVQDDYEIRVDRKDDFSLQCSFFDGIPQAIANPYGRESCSWDGDNLVSTLLLPDKLQIVHRFTVSPDRQELRIITTISSSTSPVPFTLRRFYTRFDRPTPKYACIETLSMKRVCSTGDLEL